MSAIKNVVVFGASGSIGPYIIQALLAYNFNVTAVSRTNSNAKYSSCVIGKTSDYSPDSLHDILTGQDAVVSCIARTESATELKIVEAAEAAGVQRFLPSEYGADLHDAIPEYTMMLAGKLRVLEHLKQRAAANKNFTWTTILPGPFFDYFLYAIPSISFDPVKREAVIYDSGNAPWTGTTLASVGGAVANVLLKPMQTANRELRTRTLQSTQNEILATFETATGSQWNVKKVNTKDVAQSGTALLQSGKYAKAYAALFTSQIWGDSKERGITVTEDESDNVLLGVKNENIEALCYCRCTPEHLDVGSVARLL